MLELNPLVTTKDGARARARREDHVRRQRDVPPQGARGAPRSERRGRGGARGQEVGPLATSRSTATSAAWSTARASRCRRWTSSSTTAAQPANFLDVGGGATAEKVTAAFKIITTRSGREGDLRQHLRRHHEVRHDRAGRDHRGEGDGTQGAARRAPRRHERRARQEDARGERAQHHRGRRHGRRRAEGRQGAQEARSESSSSDHNTRLVVQGMSRLGRCVPRAPDGRVRHATSSPASRPARAARRSRASRRSRCSTPSLEAVEKARREHVASSTCRRRSPPTRSSRPPPRASISSSRSPRASRRATW